MKKNLLTFLTLLFTLCHTTLLLAQPDVKTAVIHPFINPYGDVRNLTGNGHWACTAVATGAESEDGSLVKLLDCWTGDIVTLPLDADQRGFTGSTRDCTNDGLTVVGSFNTQPAYYNGGRWHLLPKPEGYESWTGEVDNCSDDGRTMSGFLRDESWNMYNLTWRDGVVVSGQYRPIVMSPAPAMADTATNPTKEMRANIATAGENDPFGGMQVAERAKDGTVFAFTPIYPPMRTCYLSTPDGWVSMNTFLRQVYGIDFVTTTGLDYTGTPMGVSDDSRTVICISELGYSCYSLTLPRTFSEELKKVNVLADYEISPAAGSQLARMRTATIKFDREPTLIDGAVAYIYDEDGQVFATSNNFQVNTSDAQAFTISFPRATTIFTEGKKYTMVIPEGTFKTESGLTSSPEIRINYVGRANEPVKPVSILPSPTTAVTEISYYNMMMVEFDTRIQVANDANDELYTADLYRADSEKPIAKLTLAAMDNRLYLYPTASQTLMFGNDYTVRIPAGAVTDVAGFCANTAIDIEYKGGYVIAPPTLGGNYVFYDDFKVPLQSLNNFLLYDGDKQTPVSTMAKWGFEADGTPWNFSVRESIESTNYCACSHSNYSIASNSDDWMVIPQLHLTNEYYSLSFKSQSYLSYRTDSLKVYVWENDNHLSSLSANDVAAIRRDGKLIYNELQSAGADNNLLEDDWTETTLSLAEFAGKNVYICFLNDNRSQSAVFVDDIAVTYKGNYVLAHSVAENMAAQTSAVIKGYIRVDEDTKPGDMKLSVKSADGSYTDEQTLPASSMTPGETLEFAFNAPMPLALGKQNTFFISAKMNDEEQSTSGTINNLAFKPFKRVVIEEGTGAWCGNCPLGILAIENLERSFPGQIIPIGVHNDDVLAFSTYDQFLGFSAYPCGRVNRDPKILSPQSYDQNGMLTFVSQTGDETFADIAVREFNDFAVADINIGDVKYDKTTDMFSLPVDVRFAIDQAQASYNLLTVIAEDELLVFQTNYFSTYTNQPLLGQWANGGTYGQGYVQYACKDVARAIIGFSLYGQNGLIPTTVTSAEPVSNTITFSLPAAVTDVKNAKAIVMLIDASSGKIINADRKWLLPHGDETAPNAVSDMNATPIATEYFDATGRPLSQPRGLVIRRTTLSNGTVQTDKITMP